MTIFTGKDGISIDGRIEGDVLTVFSVSGRIVDDVVLTAPLSPVHGRAWRIRYQITSTHRPNFLPGSLGTYRVAEIDKEKPPEP